MFEIPDEDLPDLGFRWPKYLLSLPRIVWDLLGHSPRRGDAWTARVRADNDAYQAEDFDSLPTVQQPAETLRGIPVFRVW